MWCTPLVTCWACVFSSSSLQQGWEGNVTWLQGLLNWYKWNVTWKNRNPNLLQRSGNYTNFMGIAGVLYNISKTSQWNHDLLFSSVRLHVLNGMTELFEMKWPCIRLETISMECCFSKYSRLIYYWGMNKYFIQMIYLRSLLISIENLCFNILFSLLNLFLCKHHQPGCIGADLAF